MTDQSRDRQQAIQAKQLKIIHDRMSSAEAALRDLIKGLPHIPITSDEFMIGFEPEVRAMKLEQAEKIVAAEQARKDAEMNDESDPEPAPQVRKIYGLDAFRGETEG